MTGRNFPKKIFITLLGIVEISLGQNSSSDTIWTDLFNGNDFSGLYTYNRQNNQDIYDTSVGGVPLFRPADGQIQVYSEGNQGRGHIATIKDYSYYHMKVDIQIPSGNCGLMYHVREDIAQANPYARLYDAFPPSIEAQGQKGSQGDMWAIANVWMDAQVSSGRWDPNGNVTTAGGVRTEPGRNLGASTHQWEDGAANAWNTLEVIILGDSLVQHMVNGHKVFEGFNIEYTPGNTASSGQPLPEQPYERVPFGYGKIALQAEFAPVNYRNWEIAELIGCTDSTYEEFREYYVKHNDSACITPKSTPILERGWKKGRTTFSVNLEGSYQVHVYTIRGKKVLTQNASGVLKLNDLLELKPGLYWLKVVSPHDTYQKLIHHVR